MTDWIITTDPSYFDVAAAFDAHGVIDWHETPNAKIEVNDVVFLYSSLPDQTLTHVCRVIRTGIPFSETIDDSEYLLRHQDNADSEDGTWMRLLRIRSLSDDERLLLDLSALHDAGVRGNLQGRRKAPPEVCKLVQNVAEGDVEFATEMPVEERELLNALGYPRGSWHFQKGGRGGGNNIRLFRSGS